MVELHEALRDPREVGRSQNTDPLDASSFSAEQPRSIIANRLIVSTCSDFN